MALWTVEAVRTGSDFNEGVRMLPLRRPSGGGSDREGISVESGTNPGGTSLAGAGQRGRPTASDHPVRLDIYAGTRQEARRIAAGRGYQPISVRENRKGPLRITEKMSQKDQKVFLRNFRYQSRQNISAADALIKTIESDESRIRRWHLMPAYEAVRSGAPVHEALGRTGVFDDITLGIIRSGEGSGKTGDVIEYAIDQIESRKKGYRQSMLVAGWIFFDFLSAISVSIGIQYIYLPQMEKTGIDTRNEAVRAQFEQAIQATYLLNGTLMWGAILLGLTVIAAGLSIRLSRTGERGWGHRLVDSIPPLRDYLINQAMAYSANSFARLLRSGNTIAGSLRAAAENTGYAAVGSFWHQVHEAVVKKGKPVEEALSIPPLTLQERQYLRSAGRKDYLAESMMVLSEERLDRMKLSFRRIVGGGTMALGIYITLVTSTLVWAMMTQNDALTESLRSITNF